MRTNLVLIIMTAIVAGSLLACSQQPSNEIQVWLTLSDGSQKLTQQNSLMLETQTDLPDFIIEIDPSLLYQPVDGFGAALTDASAWLIWERLEAEQRETLLEALFSRDEGLGLSYVRVPIGASDFARESYTYADEQAEDLASFSIAHDEAYILPVLQAALAHNPELQILASPWSAPAWMKTNASLNGGELLPEHFATFANYHVQFIQAYQAAGIPIKAITPQNEPQHRSDSYPTMFMTAKDQLTFIRDHLGPALDAAGLDTQVMILDHNWNLTKYALDILADPDVRQYIAGTAFHCYGGEVAQQTLVHRAYPDKGIWFTECSGGGWSTDFGDNVSWNMQNLVIGNFRNWGRSLLLWNLALDQNSGPQNGGCTDCRGVVTINTETGAVTYNEEYYILGHLSKFVVPGAHRIESTAFELGGPQNVAFLNPDGTVTLVVHATEAATFRVQMGEQNFSYAIPAQGTVTFKWHLNPLPGATVTPQPTSTPMPADERVAPGLIQDFEAAEVVIYDGHQATASISTEIVHTGKAALKMKTTEGTWHNIGLALAEQPLNLSGLQAVCLWVYDRTEAGDNTLGVRLLDATGANQEVWSDHYANNPKTASDTWVEMCFGLDKFGAVDLTQVTALELSMYWPSDYFFDTVTVK